MRAQDEKIKGFNLLELIIVVVIIGVISGVGYPKFNEWRIDRETRSSVIKIKSLFDGINAQVKRGQYAFVQVHIKEESDSLYVTSKGMKPAKLASLINDSTSTWWSDINSRCNTDETAYWDDDGGAADNTVIQVQKLEFDANKFASNFAGEAAVCFSKDARWFSGAGNFVSGAVGDTSVDQTMFLCIKADDVPTCSVDEGTGLPTVVVDNVFSIDWTRFGDITVDKWSSLLNEWQLQ